MKGMALIIFTQIEKLYDSTPSIKIVDHRVLQPKVLLLIPNGTTVLFEHIVKTQ